MHQVPNLLTIGRILLVPVTIWLLTQGDYGVAFGVFLLAGVTDGIDGYVARRFSLQSELGAYLDPLADKLLLVSIYLTLALLHVLPDWLAILVVTRDVLIVGAILLAKYVERPLAIAPVFVSKANTLAQIAFAGGVLASLAFGLKNDTIATFAAATVAVLTVASGAVYMMQWLRHMAAGTDGNVL